MMGLLIVFLMGVILPFAFAPFSLYIIAFIAPAVLLYQWQKSTPRLALLKGGLFGLGFYGVGVSWVYISIHTYGNASPFVAGLITLAMILVLSLGPATQGYVLIRLFGQKKPLSLCLAAFPVTWVTWEWLRSLPFNGFPWLYLGYSQLDTYLAGWGPVAGVYGVSLAVAIICGCLVIITSRHFLKTKFLALAIFLVILASGWFLKGREWSHPAGPSIPVALVQANISQSLKWKPDEFTRIVETYKNMSKDYWHNSRLIIWPEAAIPAFPQQVPALIEELNQTAAENKSTLLMGILLGDPVNKPYFNGIMLLGADPGEYRKRHLVPFGEYTPLASVFSFLINYWQIPMSDFSAGAKQQNLLTVDGVKIAPFICYEIAYPLEVLKYAQQSELMINISDDSWFGESMASAQQAEMGRFRALEMGRYLILAANTGITGIIDPFGQFTQVLLPHQPGTLHGNVIPFTGKTPLMTWNYYPLLGIIFILLILCFI